MVRRRDRRPQRRARLPDRGLTPPPSAPRRPRPRAAARGRGRSERRPDRQRVLRKPDPPSLEIVVGEAALRQQVGDSLTMGGQLQRLIEASHTGLAELRVPPFSANAHPGIAGPFHILSLLSSVDASDHGRRPSGSRLVGGVVGHAAAPCQCCSAWWRPSASS
ncbi:Scr1 family TA system antitoxin-like transcriptional regulator [Actinoallomurus liliacearum]|uniref:Scr1 family TA system antitoxin-like transcriptional regulator n=1 Tax=Actinoallomurus liliacearum TaxID=1080073 RepID=UPI003CD05FA2